MDDKQKGRWIDDGWIDKCKWMGAPEVYKEIPCRSPQHSARHRKVIQCLLGWSHAPVWGFPLASQAHSLEDRVPDGKPRPTASRRPKYDSGQWVSSSCASHRGWALPGHDAEQGGRMPGRPWALPEQSRHLSSPSQQGHGPAGAIECEFQS